MKTQLVVPLFALALAGCGAGKPGAGSTPPAPAPTASLAANPSSIASGGSSTLAWSSTNATSCFASGAWSGVKGTSGSQPTGALTASGNYSLTCTGSGGGTSASASVTVSGAPPPNSYTSNFGIDENPLSEGGKWLQTDATNTKVKVVGGRAFGTQSGLGAFDDSNAYLTGFGDNYEVEGTVWVNPGLLGAGNREVE